MKEELNIDKQVFRKVSMERLSSPEQLDSLMKVTSPRGWLALIALVLLIITAVAWSFYGSLATKINGSGVLIKPGGIHQIYTSSNGQITDIRASIDDLIQKGDVIARINQPEMIQQMKQLKKEISTLESILQNSNDIVNQNEVRSKLANLQSQLTQAKTEYEIASKVVSPYTGRVLEIDVQKGDTVSVGKTIVTLELEADEIKKLVAMMYIPVNEGRKVLPGMDVQISPNSVNKEEYGFMVGRVISVSEFPASTKGMMNTLGNEALVNQLSGMGASLEVLIDLTPAIDTDSGYKWSSKQGPPVEIHSGTLAAVSIVLKKERPITSVIPQIK